MIKVLRDWMQRYFRRGGSGAGDHAGARLQRHPAFGGMLAPVLAAMVIAFLIQGVVGMLERFRVPHLFAVWLVYSLFLGLLALFLVVLLPLLWQQLFTLFNELPRMLGEWQSVLLMLPERYPSLISEEQVLKAIETARGEFGQIGQWALTSSLASLPVVVNVMIYLVLVPILVFFFLKDKKRFHTWFHRYLRARADETGLGRDEPADRHYIRGKVIEIVITGAVTYIAFAYLGLNAALLALLVGLSVVVPYIGAVVVSVPVAMIAFFQWGWGDQFIYLMVAHAIIQALDGNVLVPLLFSEAVNLHPVAIICAVLLFGGLWGFWGVFFAIPWRPW